MSHWRGAGRPERWEDSGRKRRRKRWSWKDSGRGGSVVGYCDSWRIGEEEGKAGRSAAT